MDKYLEALKEIERLTNRRSYMAEYQIMDSIQDILNDLKHCPKCDEWVGFDDRFCKSCGHKLGADE